jgi:hypothetical protein
MSAQEIYASLQQKECMLSRDAMTTVHGIPAPSSPWALAPMPEFRGSERPGPSLATVPASISPPLWAMSRSSHPV